MSVFIVIKHIIVYYVDHSPLYIFLCNVLKRGLAVFDVDIRGYLYSLIRESSRDSFNLSVLLRVKLRALRVKLLGSFGSWRSWLSSSFSPLLLHVGIRHYAAVAPRHDDEPARAVGDGADVVV